jgi:hypothetical protein
MSQARVCEWQARKASHANDPLFGGQADAVAELTGSMTATAWCAGRVVASTDRCAARDARLRTLKM